MEITPIGFILLIAGPLMAIARPDWLYVATVFFLPFTATALVNVGSGDNTSGLQASMYLGTVLIARIAIQILWSKKVSLPLRGKQALLWLGLFVATATISIGMPLWIDGRLQIPSAAFLDLSSTPLYLSSKNITGVLYLVYGFLLTYLVAIANQAQDMCRKTIKTFIAGSTFAALWGCMELFCKLTGATYPAIIFNTATGRSSQGYKEALAEGLFRLSSVAVEPSIFAISLLLAIAVYLPYILTSTPLFGKKYDRIFFGILCAILCMSTSSTGYLGLFVIAAIVFLLMCARRLVGIKHIVIFTLIPILGSLFVLSSSFAQQIFIASVFSKSESSSTLERLMTINNAYEIFVKYPLLGVGWASVTSHDLIFNILANAGVIGLFTFSMGLYFLFSALYRSIKSRNASLGLAGLMQVDFGLYIALSVMMITSIASGFLDVFSFFWFILGMAIAASNQGSPSHPRMTSVLIGARKPSTKPLPC
ncbi:MAG: O-antigen ligase family protein [Acidobacteria bacterium]|nr:O-antigen ligase family protein [Acidobacteriota bacterium]